MEKSKKKKMSPVEQAAKMSVVQGIRDAAMKNMGNHLEGLKKVSVMADSHEGLKKGLDKAKEIVEKQPEDLNDEQEPQDMEPGNEAEASEGQESPEEEAMESEENLPQSPEEVDAHIQKLLAHKAKLMGK